MVYFLVVLVVIFVTPYEADYPATVLSAGCLMLLVGGARLTAGMRLSASPVETLFRWKGSFRLLVFSQFLLWGLFCALTVGLYGTEWTAMLVLFCSSALAGGGISSLAPDYKLAARSLLAIMLPTSVVAAAQGTTETYTIAFLACLYLGFLLLQAKQHADSYWATSVAAASEATRESDKLFRAAFENAGIGMALLGTAGQFLRVNGALCEMFACSEKELHAADLPSLSHADDLDTSRGMLQRMEQGETGVQFEQRYVQKQGAVVWGSVTMSAVGAVQEKQRYFVMMVQDISERKRMEEALKWTQYSVDHAADAVFWVRRDGSFVYVNDAACHSLGYVREELLDLAVWDVDPAISPDSWPARWQYVTRQRSSTFESTHRAKEGRVLPVEITVNYMSFDGEEFRCAFVRDITERKRMEDALRESEEQHRLITENVPAMILYIDSDGVVRFVNKVFERWYGKPSSTLIGQRYRDYLTLAGIDSSADNVEWYTYFDKALRGKSTSFEITIGLPDGQKQDREITYVPHFANGHAIQGVLCCSSDITSRKEAERRRDSSEKQLLQAQKLEAIGVLAGGIAHDFNNILTAIYGLIFLTKEMLPAESRAHENLDQVLKASERARDLVRQILAFSRQGDEKRRRVDIASLVREALKLLRASLPVSIEIREEIESDCGAVLADSTQIHQVVVNLCTNAYQAMRHSGGLLTVSLRPVEVDAAVAGQVTALQQGSYVKLTVGDTSSGIDANVQQHIFDPFFTTKAVGEGTGLGLSVVHGIVTSHHGAISFESDAGKGTKFFVYLPRVESGPVEQAAVDKPTPTGAEHILFVDDEEAIVQFGQRALERLGYRVTTRTSSVEALDLFRAQPDRYDVVLCDVTMPIMSGIDLGIELMAIRSDVPVILMTGFSELVTREKAKNMGFRELVMKPFAVSDLAKTLRGVTEEAKRDNYLRG